ncbi:MAG: hypothetical protein JHC26_08585 [Thermofilum sp.]|uniref:hypothetical protein n=1 Tax=Thermofilum sp. TaxID=1961369 RepID=UPI0025866F44|nr:hypothetical protein [Thermofilum sp.]MCI4409133.1 hypothetical protein [Thermofilum sp.]
MSTAQNTSTQNTNENKDEFVFTVCEYTDLYVYVNPFDKNEITFELYNSFEDLPKFDARKMRLEDLGLKSIDELVKKLKKDKRFLFNIIRLFNKYAVVDDKRIDCYELEENMGIYGECDDSDSKRKKVLIIEKFSDGSGFRFWVKGDPCGYAWAVRQHPDDKDLVVLTFERSGRELGSVFRSYKYFSVDHEITNMSELIGYMTKEPNSTAYYITLYSDLDFDEVKVVEKPADNK